MGINITCNTFGWMRPFTQSNESHDLSVTRPSHCRHAAESSPSLPSLPSRVPRTWNGLANTRLLTFGDLSSPSRVSHSSIARLRCRLCRRLHRSPARYHWLLAHVYFAVIRCRWHLCRSLHSSSLVVAGRGPTSYMAYVDLAPHAFACEFRCSTVTFRHASTFILCVMLFWKRHIIISLLAGVSSSIAIISAWQK